MKKHEVLSQVGALLSGVANHSTAYDSECLKFLTHATKQIIDSEGQESAIFQLKKVASILGLPQRVFNLNPEYPFEEMSKIININAYRILPFMCKDVLQCVPFRANP